MSHPTAWDSDGLRAKATIYFDRAFGHDHDDPLFAFWCHLALEQLARAAVAKVNPALLAGSRRQDALLYGLGVIDADPLQIESAGSGTVYQLCERLVDGFGAAEQDACEMARRRRNAELHSAIAAMEDLPRGWVGRFFAACRVLGRHLGLGLEDLLGSDRAQLVERLMVEDAEDVRRAVRQSLDAARGRAAALSSAARREREEQAREKLHPLTDPLAVALPARAQVAGPRLLKEVPCPACTTVVGLRGDIVARNPTRIDEDNQLVATQVGVPGLLQCPVCGLRLEGVAELAVAGLGDPVTLTEYVDPVEAFDIDLSEYHDEFLRGLAEDSKYQDE